MDILQEWIGQAKYFAKKAGLKLETTFNDDGALVFTFTARDLGQLIWTGYHLDAQDFSQLMSALTTPHFFKRLQGLIPKHGTVTVDDYYHADFPLFPERLTFVTVDDDLFELSTGQSFFQQVAASVDTNHLAQFLNAPLFVSEGFTTTYQYWKSREHFFLSALEKLEQNLHVAYLERVFLATVARLLYDDASFQEITGISLDLDDETKTCLEDALKLENTQALIQRLRQVLLFDSQEKLPSYLA